MVSRPALQHAGMRAHNLALVLGELADGRPLSRAQLAGRTRLTKSSVSALVADLLTGGLVTESEARATGERGRPGTTLALDRQGAAGLGLEVNVDYLAALVSDLGGTPRYRHVVLRDNRDRSPADVLGEVADLAVAAVRAAEEQGLRLAGACLAVPGNVDAARTLLVRAPNLGWSDVDLPDALGFAPPLPLGFTAENEADLAALGELWFGNGDLGDFVHVSGEVGIGGGIVTGGRLFRGGHARAGELGHVVVDPDGPACACGGRGCLERLAGQDALLALAGAPDTATLLAACRTGDPAALAAVSTAGRHLGVALASVTNLLDPSSVVLGGLFSALAPWLAPAVEETLARHLPGDRGRPRLVVSRLGADAAVRGAAGSVVRRVLSDPAGYLALGRAEASTPA